MLERDIESKLKWLEGFGFEVFKLRTPGKNGVMDRMILQPTWSPAPPAFLELKRPGKEERALQAARRDNWRARGCNVLNVASTVEEVQDRCERMLVEAVSRWSNFANDGAELPAHISDAYFAIVWGKRSI